MILEVGSDMLRARGGQPALTDPRKDYKTIKGGALSHNILSQRLDPQKEDGQQGKNMCDLK